MCIIVVAFDTSERYPLMIAANRDERHARASTAAGWWDDAKVLAGRDLVAGGAWLGMSDSGRIAAVTNIFEPEAAAAPASRGMLVSGFLTGTESPAEYAATAEADGSRFGPFNLLLYDSGALVYASNRRKGTALAPGLHVFGNNAPGEDWPKLELARRGMERVLANAEPAEDLLTMLAEGSAGPAVSPRDSIFVVGETFGTRSSTVVLLGVDNRALFVERRFGPGARFEGESCFEVEVVPSGLTGS